ncbi:MAG: hypothetical protein ABIN61_02440 [candidate division WOR-3 bacterium]
MGESELELIPLKCPECGENIESGEEDLVHFCSFCGNGFEVVYNKIRKIDVLFAKPEREVRNKKIYYLPMWRIPTNIYIEKKFNIKINQLPSEILSNEKFAKSLIDLFNKEKAQKKITFFVPAYGVTNKYLLSDQPELHFTITQPEIIPDSPKDMVGAEYSLEDAKELAKVMFFSIQMQTKSFFKEEDVNFEFIDGNIVGVPFYEEGGMLIDGIKGCKIFKDSLTKWDKIKDYKENL